MTSEDDNLSGQPKRSRPPKPPLTIDLAANPTEDASSRGPDEAAAEPVDPPAEASAAPASDVASAGASAEDPAAAPPRPTESPTAAAPADVASRAPGRSAAAPPPSSPPPASPPHRPSRLAGYAVAGLIGAVVAIAAVIAVDESGVMPSPGKNAADAAAAKANATAAAISAVEKRLAAVETQTTATASATKDIAARMDAVESTDKAVSERLGKAEAALAAPPQTGNPNIDQVLDELMARLEKVETAIAKAESVSPPPSPATVELEARVAALESSLTAMSQRLAAQQARPPAATESEKAARALAIGTLRRAASEGAPFAGDLAMLQALGLDETDIAALRPLAEKGAPPKAELAAAFPELADRILAASAAADPDAGFFDRLAGFARGLVNVRPTSPIPGDTPDAVVSRMQAAVDAGDLARALSERDALPKNAKAISAAWAEGASDRMAIDRLVEKLSRAAGAVAAGAAN